MTEKLAKEDRQKLVEIRAHRLRLKPFQEDPGCPWALMIM
jgi:hypothetical protein